ncbi:MAG: 3-oxoacyl-[acyl-carrier-protein] reductase [Paraclostridium sp.]
MIDFTNKVAIVTGGSRGIGKAIAKKLALFKANIIINYTSNEEEALKTKAEIEELGVKTIVVKCDVSKSDEVEGMINTAIEEFGQIDILVNNAGITRDGLLMRMKEDDFDRVIDINLKGVFNCTKAVTKPMMKKRCGKIINISSVVGLIGNPGQANYCAAKAGVIGLTKSTARELASRNISVNAIAPGFINTDMTNVLSEDLKNSMLNNIPQNRFGESEDVANAVVFLASDMSNYITGQVINVDGGMVMQ